MLRRRTSKKFQCVRTQKTPSRDSVIHHLDGEQSPTGFSSMENYMRETRSKILVHLFVAASLGVTASAWSQDDDEEPKGSRGGGSVALYGSVDLGLEALSGKSPSTNGERDTNFRVSNGISTPHFGFRGNEDLGGGMRAGFNLENSFAPDNGTLGLGGRMFGRQSWLSLSGRLGTVRLGRQYTMFRYGFEDANPFGYGNHGLRLLDERISNPRADNSISYMGQWGPVSAGVNYSFGRDAVAGNSTAATNCAGEAVDKQQCREWSLYTRYVSGSWGVATAYERLYGGTAATFGGLTSPDKTDTRFVLAGHMRLTSGTKLAVGWIKRNNEGNVATPKSDMVWVQGVVPVGPYFIDGMLARLDYDNSPNKAMLVNVRGRYSLSKRTTLYVTAAHVSNSGTLALSATGSTPAIAPMPGGSQTSVIAGIQHTF
jgi:predicted porin